MASALSKFKSKQANLRNEIVELVEKGIFNKNEVEYLKELGILE